MIYEIYNNVAKAFLKLHLNSNNPTISRNFYWNSTVKVRLRKFPVFLSPKLISREIAEVKKILIRFHKDFDPIVILF